MVTLKRSAEISLEEATLVANRMKGIQMLNQLQQLTLELSSYTSEDEFEKWLYKNASNHGLESLKAVETFYLEGVHPSLNAIEVSIAILRDFRGEHFAKREIA